MKAERTDLPENEANVLFQPDLSAMSSTVQDSTLGGAESTFGVKVMYDTNVDANLMAATKV